MLYRVDSSELRQMSPLHPLHTLHIRRQKGKKLLRTIPPTKYTGSSVTHNEAISLKRNSLERLSVSHKLFSFHLLRESEMVSMSSTLFLPKLSCTLHFPARDEEENCRRREREREREMCDFLLRHAAF